MKASLLILALALAMAMADVPTVPKSFVIPPNPFPGYALAPDPLSNPVPTEEPADPEVRVYHCWGYLGRPTVIADLMSHFMNGTTVAEHTCTGINNLHKDCWPDMFKIWWYAAPIKINHLKRYCLTHATPPAAAVTLP